jgi:hypothetical protein
MEEDGVDNLLGNFENHKDVDYKTMASVEI